MQLSPSINDVPVPIEEKHYTVRELAHIWRVGPDTIIRIFENCPGVLVVDGPGRGKNKRPHRIIRIPASVAEAKYREWTGRG